METEGLSELGEFLHVVAASKPSFYYLYAMSQTLITHVHSAVQSFKEWKEKANGIPTAVAAIQALTEVVKKSPGVFGDQLSALPFVLSRI